MALRVLPVLNQQASNNPWNLRQLSASPIAAFRHVIGPDRKQLPLIGPFIDRMARSEPLIALQADQPGRKMRDQRLGDLGLADPGGPFDQQGPPEHQRRMHRHRVIGDISNGDQGSFPGVGRLRHGSGSFGACCPAGQGRAAPSQACRPRSLVIFAIRH